MAYFGKPVTGCGPDCEHRAKLDPSKLHRFHYNGGRLDLKALDGMTVRIVAVHHYPACVVAAAVMPITGAPGFLAYADELTPLEDPKS